MALPKLKPKVSLPIQPRTGHYTRASFDLMQEDGQLMAGRYFRLKEEVKQLRKENDAFKRWFKKYASIILDKKQKI